MYLLLFMIGFEINPREMMKKGKFIIKSTTITIFLATVFGTTLIFFIFGTDLFISIIVGLSFATVGEEILVPILDEFEITNDSLGQVIIGIGALDDIFEILTLIMVVILVGTGTEGNFNVFIIIIFLFILLVLTVGFLKLKKEGRRFAGRYQIFSGKRKKG